MVKSLASPVGLPVGSGHQWTPDSNFAAATAKLEHSHAPLSDFIGNDGDDDDGNANNDDDGFFFSLFGSENNCILLHSLWDF